MQIKERDTANHDSRRFVRMRILREKQVRDLTGLSRVTRWRMERDDRFPRRIQLTQRCIGWPEYEVIEWLKERVEARDSHIISSSAPSRKGGAQ
jgi:prophage regulatory protein